EKVKEQKAGKGQLQDFTAPVSPVSNLIVFVCFMLMYLSVLDLKWWEFLVFIGVDTLALIITLIFDKKLFLKLYPETELFFPKIDQQRISRLSESGKDELFDALISMPRKRVFYVYLVNYLKAIPVFI